MTRGPATDRRRPMKRSAVSLTRNRLRRAAIVATAVTAMLAFGSPAWAADTTPPTTPTNFRVLSSTATTVTIGWNPSSDNSGSWYYYLTDNFFQIAYPQKTQTSWTMPTSQPNTTYVYN